eukprot:TRINITY_DN5053_c0_g2_i1.p1 TRINITY_DN5053_c0_g2~~TRINITY_DN5053_c0_g2_i1.p1  ORF type:complete len:949 (-),score=163.09 TRINITY_DN5053_c0_g2_i1:150-2996(-)
MLLILLTEKAENEHNSVLQEFQQAKDQLLKVLVQVKDKTKLVLKNRLVSFVQTVYHFYNNAQKIITDLWPNLQQLLESFSLDTQPDVNSSSREDNSPLKLETTEAYSSPTSTPTPNTSPCPCPSQYGVPEITFTDDTSTSPLSPSPNLEDLQDNPHSNSLNNLSLGPGLPRSFSLPAPKCALEELADTEEPDSFVSNLLKEAETNTFNVRKVTRNLSKRRKVLAINLPQQVVLVGDYLKKKWTSLDLLQVIKSLKHPKRAKIFFTRLELYMTFSFDSKLSREKFCEFAYLLLHKKKTFPFLDTIQVFVGTWNIGETAPPNNLESWVPREKYDVYAIGVQECEYIPRHGYNTPEADWFGQLKEHLGENFIKVAGVSLGQIRLIVFSRREHYYCITHIKKGTEATGIANMIGNKGAAAISFNFFETRLCFVSSHLAAHQEKCAERKHNYYSIIKGLKLTTPPLDIVNSFHHLFWFGDLNYRIDYSRERVLELLGNKDWEGLYQGDQLARERGVGAAFVDFEEGPLLFPPTYRYARGTRTYDEERIPAWCDRILWKSLPNTTRLKQLSYGCTDKIMTSDHIPVYSTFEVKVVQHNTFRGQVQYSLVFSDLRATFLPTLKEKKNSFCDLVLDVFSDYAQDSITTSIQQKTLTPCWESHQIPPVHFITTNKDFLGQQHLYFLLRDHRDKELGVAVISLAEVCNTTEAVRFAVELLWAGKSKGCVSGSAKLVTNHGTLSPMTSTTTPTNEGTTHQQVTSVPTPRKVSSPPVLLSTLETRKRTKSLTKNPVIEQRKPVSLSYFNNPTLNQIECDPDDTNREEMHSLVRSAPIPIMSLYATTPNRTNSSDENQKYSLKSQRKSASDQTNITSTGTGTGLGVPTLTLPIYTGTGGSSVGHQRNSPRRGAGAVAGTSPGSGSGLVSGSDAVRDSVSPPRQTARGFRALLSPRGGNNPP